MLVAKRLPAALRDIPKGAEMSNPYIAARVVAHDQGKAAGKVTAITRRNQKQMDAKYPAPSKKSIVLNPVGTAYDSVNRYYVKGDVKRGQAIAQNVMGRGRQAREISRKRMTMNPAFMRRPKGPFGVETNAA